MIRKTEQLGGKFTFKNKGNRVRNYLDHKTAYGKDKIATTAASADWKLLFWKVAMLSGVGSLLT